jgi:two-component system chemotaxis response regulator CheB
MLSKIRTLLVNDSFHTLDVMEKVCRTDPMISIIGTARNGVDAIRHVESAKPDVVVLDLTMPYMDGPTTLRNLMSQSPIPVLICAPDDADKPAHALSCLSMGAVDAILFNERIDPMTLDTHLATLPTRIKLVSTIRPIRMLKSLGTGKPASIYGNATRSPSLKARTALAIGASTGGPSALKFILSKLPQEFESAILIAQHMPSNMTPEFIKMLAGSTRANVIEGKAGMAIEPGSIYIAPGGKNMLIGEDKTIRLETASAFEHVPSVDTMMTTASSAFRNHTIGLVLTGMGSDGKNGVAQIKNNGGKIFAQDQETSVVFGMPKEAASTGFVDKVLPLDQIPLQLAKLIGVEENVA